MKNTHRFYRYLALGDSYTIGEGVAERENFPHQVVYSLTETLDFLPPRIVARTGWTTAELITGIASEEIAGQKYDWVTLLIGVNNQYRGQDLDVYAREFEQLLDQAMAFAGGKAQRVIVLSIPDWGVTPYASDGNKDPMHTAAEIDQFNRVNQQISLKRKVHYLDITKAYRELGGLPGYYVEDRLHPSGEIYKRWAEEIRTVILSELDTP